MQGCAHGWRLSPYGSKACGLEHAPQQQEVRISSGEVLDGAVHHKVAALRRDKGRGRLCCRRNARAGRSRGVPHGLDGLPAVCSGCCGRVGRRLARLRHDMAEHGSGVRPLLGAQRRGCRRGRQVAPVGRARREPELGCGRARRQQELWSACALSALCSPQELSRVPVEPAHPARRVFNRAKWNGKASCSARSKNRNRLCATTVTR